VPRAWYQVRDALLNGTGLPGAIIRPIE